MNKNYFSDGIMRRMRQYTLALSNNAHSKDKDLENLLSLKKADEITQTVYDREVEKINQQIGEQGNKLLSEVKVDLMGTFEKMREIAKAQISKAPTTEMVNTLKLLCVCPVCIYQEDDRGGKRLHGGGNRKYDPRKLP